MLKIIIILLILLVAITQAKLVVLGDSNYTTFVATHKYVFVKFYMPNCSHCIAMADDYKKLAEASINKEYIIAQVDVTINRATHQMLRISRFPAMKFLVHGYAFEFSGNRTTNYMQSWIQSKMLSQITQISKEQSQNQDEQNFVVIGGGSKYQLEILSYAQKINQIPYYHFDGDQFVINLYLQNSKKLTYKGDITIQKVSEWVTTKLKGYLVPLKNQQVIREIFQNRQFLPALLLLKNRDFSNDNFQILSSFCQAELRKLKCAYADPRHQIYQGIHSLLNLDDKQHSFLIYFDYEIRNGYKVPNPTSLTTASLKQFVQEVSQGKIEKYYDQQAIRQKYQIKYENVVKLNVSNFNTTIQANKYVFIQYYSIYCKYCQQFAAEYEALARELKQEKPQFLIAAVDIDEQYEIKQYAKVNGYPTFRYYYRGEELDYLGEINKQSITTYMRSVQTSKLKTISNIADIIRPAVVIYGIDQDSPLHLLPFIYKRFPIYQFKGKSPFKVQIHQKKYSALYGQKYLHNLVNWLYQQTEPSVVNITGQKKSRKLSTALQEQMPLLILVNRDNSAQFKKLSDLFQSFCSDKIQYLCGIASEQQIQFQNFNQWLGEWNTQKNSLVYITANKFEKYIYEDDLSKLNQMKIKQFIDDIKNGKIKPIANKQIEDTSQSIQNEDKQIRNKSIGTNNKTEQQMQQYALDDQF